MFRIADVGAVAADRFKMRLGKGRRYPSSALTLIKGAVLDDRFIDRVDAELPPQPWKRGIHRLVAEKLGCTRSDVSAAISALVENGRRNIQRNGVVYGSDGRVIATDPDRAG
jgi:hypothetical protein